MRRVTKLASAFYKVTYPTMAPNDSLPTWTLSKGCDALLGYTRKTFPSGPELQFNLEQDCAYSRTSRVTTEGECRSMGRTTKQGAGAMAARERTGLWLGV